MIHASAPSPHLRKRGITPEAIKKMIIDVGIKSNDVTLSWENLFSYNRKILDATSNRYFFVSEPFELKVLQMPKTFNAKLPLHPDKPEWSFREYTVLHRRRREKRNLLDFTKDAEVTGKWQSNQTNGALQRQS